MKEILGVLRMDLCRGFASFGFLAAALSMCLALFSNSSTEVRMLETGLTDVLYLYNVAHIQSFSVLYVIFAALPYATSFCVDWNHQFIRSTVIRTSVEKYGFSKVTACALSGGAAIALGELLFIFLLRLNLPLVNTQNPVFENITSLFLGSLLTTGHFAAYFAARILVVSAAAAVFAVLALMISTFITNVFVTLGFPLIAFYSLIGFSGQLGLPEWLNFHSIISGVCLNTPIASVAYSVLCCSLICVLLGVITVRQIKRRLEHG